MLTVVEDRLLITMVFRKISSELKNIPMKNTKIGKAQ